MTVSSTSRISTYSTSGAWQEAIVAREGTLSTLLKHIIYRAHPIWRPDSVKFSDDSRRTHGLRNNCGRDPAYAEDPFHPEYPEFPSANLDQDIDSPVQIASIPVNPVVIPFVTPASRRLNLKEFVWSPENPSFTYRD